MTAEILQKHLSNNFRLRILGNMKVFEKTKIGWRQMLVASQLCRNKFLVIVVKIYTEADFKVSWYCPILLDFFTYFQIFLFTSRMVGVYYSWEYIVNVSDSIKQESCLLQVRKEIISKNIKKFHTKNPKVNSKTNYDQTAATQEKFI